MRMGHGCRGRDSQVKRAGGYNKALGFIRIYMLLLSTWSALFVSVPDCTARLDVYLFRIGEKSRTTTHIQGNAQLLQRNWHESLDIDAAFAQRSLGMRRNQSPDEVGTR